jgi:hypothetical protein
MGKVKKAIRALKKEEKAAKEEVSAEDSIQKAMLNLNQNMSTKEQRTSIPFDAFLNELVAYPKTVTRNIFQVFHDMMKAYAMSEKALMNTSMIPNPFNMPTTIAANCLWKEQTIRFLRTDCLRTGWSNW